jgi:hypothetical protein
MADHEYATRTPEKYSEELDRWIDVGGSPRASLGLDKCGRTHAWFRRTEHYAYRVLQRSVRSGSPAARYQAMITWLDRLAPGMSARRFASDCGDDALFRAVESLSAGLHRPGGERHEKGETLSGIDTARRRLLRATSAEHWHALPPLSPAQRSQQSFSMLASHRFRNVVTRLAQSLSTSSPRVIGWALFTRARRR